MLAYMTTGEAIAFGVLGIIGIIIIKQQRNIMATIQELSAKVDELQTKLDAEQQQVQDAINNLNSVVAQLQQQLTDGGTAEERQAVLDKLNATISDLEGTVADAPGPTE